MSHLSKIFSKTPVDIPNRSGFDLSHENMLTMPCGTLVPVLCEEVLPNETYSLGYMCEAQLPPMATNFYGRVDMRLEAFFVPNRIIWGSWQNFMTMPVNNPFSPEVIRQDKLPGISASDTLSGNAPNIPVRDVIGAGTLLDYLGYKVYAGDTFTFPDYLPNILPLLTYHKIYDDWYRNPNITAPLFVRAGNSAASSALNISQIPFTDSDYNLSFRVGRDVINGELRLNHGLYFLGNRTTPSPGSYGNLKHIFSLHQRQWGKDYYTTASLYPQSSGNLAGSEVEIDTSGSKTGLSISALRTANTLQRWLERNNIAGQRYSDQIKATWGVMPSDAILDRPLFLGSSKFGIYNRSISNTSNAGTTSGNNPFSDQLGGKAGSMNGFNNGSLIPKFKSTEHGYIMVLASIVPHAQYSSGTRRYFLRSKIGDFANPLLQGLGEQPLYTQELTGTDSPEIFGYQQQYSEYKYHDDEVHGLLRDGESLSSFALQRTFSGTVSPELSTAFLEIPKEFLDPVLAVDSDMGAVTWCDFYFSLKKTSPLSEYVIPTLGDLKNTHKENVDYRGRYL